MHRVGKAWLEPFCQATCRRALSRVHMCTENASWGTIMGLAFTAKHQKLSCNFSETASRLLVNLVVTCAGIFIEDILNAVPIDKYFELFKPGAAGPGGFIRISMNFDAAATTPYHSPGKPTSCSASHIAPLKLLTMARHDTSEPDMI